jgi:pimeloyl-ACP methyl ester carboxylesterase
MPQIEVDGSALYYEEAGEGLPLVLLHGLGASLEDWECQMPVFSQRYRVIAMDLRGFNRSPHGPGALSIPRFAADVWAMLAHLGVDRFHLIGHSMGGAVALQLALDHPGAVIKLVIANSVPSFRPQTIKQRFEVWYRQVLMRLLGPLRLAQVGAQRMYPGEHQQALREKSAERGARNGPSYLEALKALTRWSVLARLQELRMPVLVLAAEHDYFSREDMLQFAHALPKGRFHLFPDAHHGLPLEQPQAFNAAVLKFLDGGAVRE